MAGRRIRPRSVYSDDDGNIKRTMNYFSAAAHSNRQLTSNFVRPSVAGAVAHQANNSNFVNFINSNSRFNEMTRDELIENMYVMEPEIASAIDSFSVMVKESFQSFGIINNNQLNNMPKTLQVDEETVIDYSGADKNLSDEMVDVANKLSDEWELGNLFESYATILMMHGTLFLKFNKNNLSISIIPNDRVTILDSEDKIGSGSTGITYDDIILSPNVLVIDEGLEDQRILRNGEFFIIKYRDTPLYIQDMKGRTTYNIYGVSPLRRAIIPVWYRRNIMATDATWRSRNVPREHHQLSADSFNTGLFTGGDKWTQMRRAQAAAQQAIDEHSRNIEMQAPDEAYVTLDTTKIDVVEPKSSNYMQANELINQMTDIIYSSLNLPRSVVKGVSDSNYASELVISAYTSKKVMQLAKKISKVLMVIVKKRLLRINPSYPVELLEMNLNYNMANSETEAFKDIQIMGSMGAFTEDEIRNKVNYKPLTDEQRKSGKIVNTSVKEQSATNNGSQLGGMSDGTTKYPTTPQSAAKQPTDSAQAVLNKPSNKTRI